VIVSNATMSGNYAYEGDGGAIYSGCGNVTVTDTVMSDNCACSGGAIFSSSYDGDVEITGGSMCGNTASYGCGGAIFNCSGNVEITGATMDDNNAASDGGAVYMESGILTVDGGTMDGNEACTGSGGAIWAGGAVFLQNGASLSRNKAYYHGGAVYIASGGTVTVNGSTLGITGAPGSIGNEATYGDGGAVYISSGALSISGGTISGNTAGGDGGAIWALNPQSFQITGGSYVDNIASGDGGAIYFDGNTATIDEGTSFESNEADKDGDGLGGAIYFDGTQLDLTDVLLDYNDAWHGGGIYASGTLEVEGGSMTNNGAGGAGGAVYTTAVLNLTTATLDSNSAVAGGAIYAGGSSVTIIGSSLDDNYAVDGVEPANSYLGEGGALQVWSGDVTITSTSMAGNRAYSYAGAISFSGGSLAIQGGSSFTDNHAENNSGGALAMFGGSATISDTTMDSNDAYGSGGAIYTDSPLALTDVSLTNNNAAWGNGGGLAVSDWAYGDVTVTNTTLSGNGACAGGGISIGDLSGAVELTQVTLSDNWADTNGGGLFVDDSDGTYTHTLTNVTIVQNVADGLESGTGTGGGIYVGSSSEVVVHNSIVAENWNDTFSGPADDVSGVFDNTSSYNLIGAITGSTGLDHTSTQSGTAIQPLDSGIGPLADNGGSTLTHDLLSSSLAINAGSNAVATAAGLTTDDQRGESRSADAPGVQTPIVDIGAVEYEWLTASFSPTGSLSVVQGELATFTSTVNKAPGTLIYEWAILLDDSPWSGIGVATDGPTLDFGMALVEGTYKIGLTVSAARTDSLDISVVMPTTTATMNVTANTAPNVPTITSSSDLTDVKVGQRIVLDAVASDANDDHLDYAWSITDNADTPILLPNFRVNDPSVTFVPDLEGTYKISLTVSDLWGEATVATVTEVEVSNAAATVVISGPAETPESNPGSLTFTAWADDPGGGTLTYEWTIEQNGQPLDLADFGPAGGVTNSKALVLETLPDDDGPDAEYKVWVKVTEDGDLETSASHTLTVVNQPPGASITSVLDTVDEGTDDVTFTIEGDDAAGTDDPLTFEWFVEYEGHPYAQQSATSFTDSVQQDFDVADDGTYVIFVTVRDGDGGATAVEHTLVAEDVSPTIDLTPDPLTIGAGRVYTLGLGSSDVSTADDVTSWVIDWDDGTTQTVPSDPGTVTHIYAAQGSYDIDAWAIDEDGHHHASSPITVSITGWTNTVPDLTDGQSTSLAVTEDGQVSGQLLVTDATVTHGTTLVDSEGDVVQFRVSGSPSDGDVVIDPDLGSSIYTPDADSVADDAFTVQASDNGFQTYDALTVTVNMTAVNDVPEATPQALQMAVNASTYTITLGGVDVETDVALLTYSISSSPAAGEGTLSNFNGNQIDFTPAANFNGVTTFEFTVTDDDVTDPQTSAPAAITIVLNTIPVANSQSSVQVTEDIEHSISLTGSDVVDGSPLTYALTSDPLHGTVWIDESNVAWYTPDPNFNGTGANGDQFTFQVSDGVQWSSDATVTIDVIGVTDLPVAHDQAVAVPTDQQVTITLTGELPEGGTISFGSGSDGVDQGTLGAITGNTVTYLPDTGAIGADSFTFTATDGSGTSLEATVELWIAPGVDEDAFATPVTPTGTTQLDLSVLGIDETNETNLLYTWSVTSVPDGAAEPVLTFAGEVENGTNGARTARATLAEAGEYTFRAEITDQQGATTSSDVTRTVDQTLTSVNVVSVTRIVGDSDMQLQAVGMDQFGMALEDPATFTWAIDSPVSPSSMLSTLGELTIGSLAEVLTVSATSDSISGTGDVDVVLALTQPPISGATQVALTAIGTASSATRSYAWTTTALPVGAAAPDFSSSTVEDPTVTFYQAGDYTFQVVIDNGTDMAAVAEITVQVAAQATSLLVTPASPVVALSADEPFTATCLDQFNAEMDMPVGATVLWSLVSGVGAMGSDGVYTAPGSAGTATVKAELDGYAPAVEGQTTIAVSDLQIKTPASLDNQTDTTVDLSVETEPVGSFTYTWTTLVKPDADLELKPEGAVPSFSDNGTSTAFDPTVTFDWPGFYTFQVAVTDGTGTVTSQVDVTAYQVYDSVNVSAAPSRINAGGHSLFDVFAQDQFGAPLPDQPAWTWELDQAGAGWVDADLGLYVDPDYTGNYVTLTVSDELTGLISGQTGQIEINDAPTIQTSLSAPSPVTGTTATVSVIGTDSDGVDAELTYTWMFTQIAGDGQGVVLGEPNGEPEASSVDLTFHSAGTYTLYAIITDDEGATLETESATIQVNQTYSAVSVTPQRLRLGHDQTFEYSAAKLDQFGNAMADQSGTWTWDFSGTHVGSFISDGVYEAPSSGMSTDTIEVTNGAYSGQANVAISLDIGSDQTVDEGSDVEFEALTGSGSFTFAWYVNDRLQTGETDSEYTLDQEDDLESTDGETVIVKCIATGTGVEATAEALLTIKKVAPTLTLDSTTAKINEGAEFKLKLIAPVDPGGVKVTKWTIDWNDGGGFTEVAIDINAATSPYPVEVSHTYDVADPDVASQWYVISAWGEDEDGRYVSKPFELEVVNLSPGVPADLEATLVDDGTVTLTWEPGARATHHTVVRTDEDGAQRSFVTNDSSLVDDGADLVSGVLYTYAVIAHANGAQSASSNAAMVIAEPAKPHTSTITDYEPTQEDGQGEVSLTWTAATYAQSYVLYRKLSTDTGDPIIYATLDGSETTFDDTGVEPGTDYTYSIVGVNEGRQGDVSEVVTALTIPAAPINLRGTYDLVNDRIDLQWDASTGATVYKLYRIEDGGTEETIEPDLTSPSYTDTSVDPTKAYDYRVEATNGESEVMSESSEQITVSALALPDVQNFTAVAGSSTSDTWVDLSWTRVPDCDGYRVYRGQDEIQDLPASDCSYRDTDVDAGETHTYKITAYRTVGAVEVTAEVTASATDVKPVVPNLNLLDQVVAVPSGAEMHGTQTFDSRYDSTDPGSLTVAEAFTNELIYESGMLFSSSDDDADRTDDQTVKMTFGSGKLRNWIGPDLAVFSLGDNYCPLSSSYYISVEFTGTSEQVFIDPGEWVWQMGIGDTDVGEPALLEVFPPGPAWSFEGDVYAVAIDLSDLGVPLGQTVDEVYVRTFEAQYSCGSSLLGVGAFEGDWDESAVDMDVDSDNDALAPDETDAEDAIEAEYDLPGRYVVVNNDDDDGDGIPDFADGFDLDSLNTTPIALDNSTENGNDFVPVVISLVDGDGFNNDDAKIWITYDMASNPGDMTAPWSTDGASLNDPYKHELPSDDGYGKVRLWMQDEATDRNKAAAATGHYVAPGEYKLTDLFGTDGDSILTLYAEGVRPSSELGDCVIMVDVSADGTEVIGTDEIRLTVLASDIMVDSDNSDTTNRQGPDPASADDQVEDVASDAGILALAGVVRWGKEVALNYNDMDGDGVPDWADGFDLDGISDTETFLSSDKMITDPDSAKPSELANPFVPLTLSLSGAIDLDVARLKIVYDASDPAEVQIPFLSGMESTMLFGDTYALPADGTLRIWQDPRSELTLEEIGRDWRPFYHDDATTGLGNFVPANDESGESAPQYYGPDELTDLGLTDTNREVQLLIERVRPAILAGDQVIQILVDPDGDGPAGFISTDVIRLSTDLGDLDIDSDNTSAGEPDRTLAEEEVENIANLPGKIITVNSGDKDKDGVPDFADGYTGTGRSGVHVINTMEWLVPMQFEIPEWIAEDLDDVRFGFNYDASDPADLAALGGENAAYLPADGSLRIWHDDSWNAVNNHVRDSRGIEQEDGHFVDTKTEYSAENFGFTYTAGGTRTIRVWVEAVRPSQSLGDLDIEFFVNLVGDNDEEHRQVADTVRLTAIQPMNNAATSEGVRLADGVVTLTATDLQTEGFFGPWGHSRVFTTDPLIAARADTGLAGNGVVSNLPSLIQATNSIIVVSGADMRVFDRTSQGEYLERFAGRAILEPSGGGYTLTESDGTRWLFHDFTSQDTSTEPLGAFEKQLAPSGAEVASAEYENGEITKITRSDGEIEESYVYSYYKSYDKENSHCVGMLESVEIIRTNDKGDDDLVRGVSYTYYKPGESHGNPGDLKLVRAGTFGYDYNAYGGTHDSTYYRYETKDDPQDPSLLKLVVGPDSFWRMDALNVAYETVDESALAKFADYRFEYDSDGRVEKQWVKGHGQGNPDDLNASTAGGYQYSYYDNYWAENSAEGSGDVHDPVGYNIWQRVTFESSLDTTLESADGETYTDFAGQTILTVATADGQEWANFTARDAQGRVSLTAMPSAIETYDIESLDLMELSGGTYQNLRANEGLISHATYYSTADGLTEGDPMIGLLKEESIAKGSACSTPVKMRSVTYQNYSHDGVELSYIEYDTTYQNHSPVVEVDRLFSYIDFVEFQAVDVITTLPEVGDGENGPATSGNPGTTRQTYDLAGRMTELVDADDYRHTWEFDTATGAVITQVVDADGLNLTTITKVDQLGRPLKVTDPGDHVTSYVYFEQGSRSRVTVTTPALPVIEIERDRSVGTLTTTQYDPKFRFNSSGGFNTEPTVVWSDLAGRTVRMDAYKSWSDKDTTEYKFDALGRAHWTKDASGLITETKYDGLGRATETYISSRLCTTPYKTREYIYDNADAQKKDGETPKAGDSNVTRAVVYAGSFSGWDTELSLCDRITTMAYDWRNRLTATTTGIATDPAMAAPQTSYFVLNNYDQIVSESLYAGKYVPLDANSDGVPDAPSDANSLRAKTVKMYDKLGREYRMRQYQVKPQYNSDGSMKDEIVFVEDNDHAITTNRWYDDRGNVLMVHASGGPTTEMTYDGAGRLLTQYVTNGGGGHTLEAADDRESDIILEQVDTAYDKSDNPLLVTTQQRLHDGSGTRTTYMGYFYDSAGRVTRVVDYGTNGGKAVTTPLREEKWKHGGTEYMLTSYEYDTGGRVKSMTTPSGTVTQSTYDWQGRVTTRVENINAFEQTPRATNRITTYTYDELGRHKTVTQDLPGSSDTTTTHVYRYQGNGVFRHITALPEDDRHRSSRESEMVNWLGEEMFNYNRDGVSHLLTRDALGRLVEDKVGTVATYRSTRGSGDREWEAFDLEIHRVTYDYDSYGQLHKVASWRKVDGKPEWEHSIVDYHYNGLGQVTAYFDRQHGSYPSVSYEYTLPSQGSRLKKTEYLGRGPTTEYKYEGLDDQVGRVTKIEICSHVYEEYHYLGLSTVVQLEKADGRIVLSYLKKDPKRPEIPGDEESRNTQGGSIYSGLDRFGRIVEQNWYLISPDGETSESLDWLQYGYDSSSRVAWAANLLKPEYSELYEYDQIRGTIALLQRSRLGSTFTIPGHVAIGSWELWHGDAEGQQTVYIENDGIDEQETWTNSNKESLWWRDQDFDETQGRGTAGAKPMYDRKTTIDAWGRLTRIVGHDNRSGYGASPEGHERVYVPWRSFSYDALGRLRFADYTVPEGSGTTNDRSYSYDADGRLIEQSHSLGGGEVEYLHIIPSAASSKHIAVAFKTFDLLRGPMKTLYPLQDALSNVTAIVMVVDGDWEVEARYLYTGRGDPIFLKANWYHDGPDRLRFPMLYQNMLFLGGHAAYGPGGIVDTLVGGAITFTGSPQGTADYTSAKTKAFWGGVLIVGGAVVTAGSFCFATPIGAGMIMAGAGMMVSAWSDASIESIRTNQDSSWLLTNDMNTARLAGVIGNTMTAAGVAMAIAPVMSVGGAFLAGASPWAAAGLGLGSMVYGTYQLHSEVSDITANWDQMDWIDVAGRVGPMVGGAIGGAVGGYAARGAAMNAFRTGQAVRSGEMGFFKGLRASYRNACFVAGTLVAVVANARDVEPEVAAVQASWFDRNRSAVALALLALGGLSLRMELERKLKERRWARQGHLFLPKWATEPLDEALWDGAAGGIVRA